MFYSKNHRNRDFMSAVAREALNASGSNISFNKLIERTVASPAPHYYVEFETALRRLRDIRLHGIEALRVATPLRRNMWLEIHSKVNALMMQRPSLCLQGALARVLATERASSFFISPTLGTTIFRQLSGFMFPDIPDGLTLDRSIEYIAKSTLNKKQIA